MRVTLIFLGSIFLGGALLSPWIYSLAQATAEQSPWLAAAARQPFPRYVNRSLLLLALAGLWPFLRRSGVGSWCELGFGAGAGRWRQVRWGLLVGFGSLVLATAWAVLAGGRSLNLAPGVGAWLHHVSGAAATAVFVGVVEEIIFRGALLGALQKSLGKNTSLIASSLIYAAAHFLKRAGSVEQVRWDSGLVVLLDMARGFAHIEMLVPELLNLTLAGLLLGWAFQRTRALYASIGLHGGWIFWLKLYGYVTLEANTDGRWFWGTGAMMDGWLASVVLLGSLWTIRWLEPRKGGALTWSPLSGRR
ncbi:MAG: CPBP family intramembrane metalloprotease [Verrucomicrobia bacterium]|nr:CPBP family intramembrane metalloprotease [Verrucomicrobiota bacterium]